MGVWALRNQTPYAAERNWTRDQHGMHEWLVAVRATFMITADARLRLADEQPAPLLVPEYDGEPGRSSLRYDTELLAPKPSTDVLVLGSAHAPGGRATASVEVGLRVGSIDKTLLVLGERVYSEGITGLPTTAPKPFTRLPLRYELAFGGRDGDEADARNPVGRGFARRRASLIGAPAHCIEYPRGNVARSGPAGFGPIDRHWLPRRLLAGTYDAAWAQTKQPLLPDDYDAAFALCAPVDQRPQQPLRGGERLMLINLSPEGTLMLELPRIELALESRFGRRTRAHDPPRLVTVLAEPDARRLSLVWQSVLRVAVAEADHLDETTITEQGGRA